MDSIALADAEVARQAQIRQRANADIEAAKVARSAAEHILKNVIGEKTKTDLHYLNACKERDRLLREHVVEREENVCG